MAVLNLHTETIHKEIVTGGVVADNGDYIRGNSSWSEGEECSAVQSAGTANEIAYEDGTTAKYSYIIYLSPRCKEYKYGDIVKVVFSDGREKVFSVKGVDKRQLQCKVFV